MHLNILIEHTVLPALGVGVVAVVAVFVVALHRIHYKLPITN